MKKVIFFDFFGVISSEIAVVFFNNRYEPEFAQKIKDEIFVRADAGEIDEDTTYELIAKATGENKESIRNEWYNLVHINEKLVNYILELKKTHKVYLLSNAISSYLRSILEKYDLYKCFDKTFISAEIHKIKPHADYFLHVTNELNLDPKDCIMIDDNPTNIAGAESVGINGIVFKDVDDLKTNIERIENE